MATPSLQITVSQDKDCGSFFFHDITPAYAPISAPNGYDVTGANGFDPANIDPLNSNIKIIIPDSTSHTINLVSGDFVIANIGTTGLVTKEILPTDLGLTDTIIDGIYQVFYQISDSTTGIVYTTSKYLVQDCAVTCCLDQKLAALSTCIGCQDKKHKAKAATLYEAYLKKNSARILTACGDYKGAQDALDFMTDFCSKQDCDSCN